MPHVSVLLPFFIALFPPLWTLDFCHPQSALAPNQTSYSYKNQPVQSCNCTKKTSCVRKCCAVGFYATKGRCLRSDDLEQILEIPVYDGRRFVRNQNADSGILAGVMNCDFFSYIPDEDERLYVQEDGRILTSTYSYLSNDYYCVDYLKDRGLSAFICYDRGTPEITTWKINSAGMIISIPFLLATFIVYALLPDRNLHMKALMFYVVNLMLSYLLLVIIQLSVDKIPDGVCTSMGYFALFFFLVSFFWMNVICVDIWFTFSGLRGFSGSRNEAERKRFLTYCAYAWGVPILHVAIVRIIDAEADSKSIANPGIGDGQCFLKRGYPELFYFYGPISVIITVNIVLFAITALRIRNIKKDTSMLKKDDSKRHAHENDKQTFNLYLKLLFAMGVNWSAEIISWAVNWAGVAPEEIWYLTDFCNALYGVFIFFIFVFKRSIWRMLKKRYYAFKGQPYLAHSMTTNTRITSYSTANSNSLVQETTLVGANDSGRGSSEA